MTQAVLNATDLVRAWFADPAHFRPSGKTEACVDRQLLRSIDLANKQVLNLGCYYPEDELACGGWVQRWVAVDFCQEVVAWCKTLPDMPAPVEFLQQDIRALDFPAKSFDVVCDFSTGDHLTLSDFTTMIKEVKRVLRPKGLFLCTYQNADYFVGEPLEFWEKDAGYSRSMTPFDAGSLIQKAGFFVLRNVAATEPRAGLIAQKK